MEPIPTRKPLDDGEVTLLQGLQEFLDTHELPPTVRELAVYVAWSTTECFRVLKHLQEKGYVTRGPARSMKIIP